MPTRKLDPRFKRRLRVIYFVVIGGGMLLIVPLLVRHDLENIWFLCFWILGVFSILYTTWMVSHYRCPSCGQRLRHRLESSDELNGKPVIYRCEICDIDWDLNFREPSSDGDGGDTHLGSV